MTDPTLDKKIAAVRAVIHRQKGAVYHRDVGMGKEEAEEHAALEAVLSYLEAGRRSKVEQWAEKAVDLYEEITSRPTPNTEVESDQCPACYWHRGHEPTEWFNEEAKIRGFVLSTPARLDDPKDAERLAGIDAQINHARFHEGTSDVVFLRRLLTTATRHAEALEVENVHLRTQAGLPPIKTPWEQAMRETIDGQGLSMIAMGKEVREKDEKIKALEAEVGRLRVHIERFRGEIARLSTDRTQYIEQIKALAGSLANTFGERGPNAPPATDHTVHYPNAKTAAESASEYEQTAADHTERARKIISEWLAHDLTSWLDTELAELRELIAAALAAAERAGAGKMQILDGPVIEFIKQALASHKCYGYITPAHEQQLRSALTDRDKAIRGLPLPGEE